MKAKAKTIWCPVGKLADDPHTYLAGTGVAITWDVMGDPDSVKIVCPNCAQHAEIAATDSLILVRTASNTFVWRTQSEVDSEPQRYADLGDNRVSELY